MSQQQTPHDSSNQAPAKPAASAREPHTPAQRRRVIATRLLATSAQQTAKARLSPFEVEMLAAWAAW